jgi:peptidoglycan-associated lipoprotein
MKSASAHAVLLRLACMASVWLAGCASGPGSGEPGVIVRREDTRTVWTTQEAEDAAKAAAAEADARRAAARAAAAPRASAAGQAPALPAPIPAPAPPDTGPAALPADHVVQFDFDRYEVRQEYWALVEAHARWLAADRSRRLVVEGHADERGGSEYNLALGQRRAEAVLQMMALLGVTPEQAEAVSFGDTRPLDRTRTEEGFARNRRVEMRPL